MFNWCFLTSIKGTHRVISKGMSNIYLKVTIYKTQYSENFEFQNLKKSFSCQFRGVPTEAHIIKY